MNSDLYKCAQTFICHNNFNLASIDIHFVQSVDQTLANLIQLQNTFNDICSKIDQKTQKQRAKIEQLQNRISRCNDKINWLQPQKVALTFSSPSKFVRNYKFQPQNNVSMFNSYLQRPSIKKFDINCRYQMEHNIKKIGEKSRITLDSLNQVVSLLYFKFKPKRKNSFEGDNSIVRKKRQGLGNIPNDIKYIDSLLVFNSIVNPYRHYQLVENNKVVKKTKQRTKQIQEAIPLDKAPEISTTIERFDAPESRFVPKDKELTFIGFDDDLDIDGVVAFQNNYEQISYNPSKKGIVKNNVLADPYEKNKNKTNQSNNPTNSNSTNNNPPPQQVSNNSYPSSSSDILPPPPPLNFTSTLPPPPSLDTLPPPPSLLNTLPPPPSLNSLPPPPSLGLPPPPSLGLPPPISSPPPASGGGINALLSQINNPNPLARLKRTKTKQYTGLSSNKPKDDVQQQQNQQQNGDGQNRPPPPPKQLSHMQMLQQKIRKRFRALHPVAVVAESTEETKVKGNRSEQEN